MSIREFGYAVAVSRGPITRRAWRLIRSWRQDWQALGTPELPTVWDGTRVVSGERALRQLAAEVSEAPTPRGRPGRFGARCQGRVGVAATDDRLPAGNLGVAGGRPVAARVSDEPLSADDP
jgi:hypothetical protein